MKKTKSEHVRRLLLALKQERERWDGLEYAPVPASCHTETGFVKPVFPLTLIRTEPFPMLSGRQPFKKSLMVYGLVQRIPVGSGLKRLFVRATFSDKNHEDKVEHLRRRILHALRPPPDYSAILNQLERVADSRLAGYVFSIIHEPCDDMRVAEFYGWLELQAETICHRIQTIRDGILLEQTSWQELGLTKELFEYRVKIWCDGMRDRAMRQPPPFDQCRPKLRVLYDPKLRLV